MKGRIVFLILTAISNFAFGQQPAVHKPKLVVGIVVDQMRQEYLYRFYSKYSDRGFKRLMNEGFMLMNAHYNYVPTFTGPGHSSIFTGTTPAVHGIIGNEFYDKIEKKIVNCVEDQHYATVGAKEGNGALSPGRLLTTTITDELRLATQKRSKVIGISFKDRGAILPAGHLANGAYWYNGKTGKFISSSYYMNKLPAWLDNFHELALPDKYLSQVWNTFFPVDQYLESGPDESAYETKFIGKDKTSFPYNLKELRKKNGDYNLLSLTPFACDYLTEMAKAAIDGEQLGKDEWTDFLTISYSTPDLIGHAMGPNAIEVEDTYIRLDKNIEDLLNNLDKSIGEGNYTVFLTADHGVAEVPQYLRDNKVPAGYFNADATEAGLKEFLQKYFPDKKIIEDISNFQIFLNQNAFSDNPKSAGIDLLVATELINNYLMSLTGVADVYTERTLRQGSFSEAGIRGMVIRGYNVKRSGDISYVLEPGWMEWGKLQGSTHGSPYSYDTSVPVLFYGAGIKKGSTVHYHSITDIAPTLSILLKVKFPNGCTGQPIEELFGQ